IQDLGTQIKTDESHTKDSTITTKLHALQGLKSISARRMAWSRPVPKSSLTVQDLRQCLRQLGLTNFQKVILSVTHDDYTVGVGGIQFCVQNEENQFTRDGHLYLNLHPYNPQSVLATEQSTNHFIFQMLVNGKVIGAISAPVIVTFFNELGPVSS